MWPDQHAAVFWDGQRLVPYPHAAHAFQNKIKLLRADVFVQRVRALGRQPPKSCSEVFALGSLKEIRVWDFHQVRGTPVKVVWRNQKVTFYRFHRSWLTVPNPARREFGRTFCRTDKRVPCGPAPTPL